MAGKSSQVQAEVEAGKREVESRQRSRQVAGKREVKSRQKARESSQVKQFV